MFKQSALFEVIMDKLPFSRWHKAVFYRISRRNFDSKGLESEELSSLREFCHDFRPFSGVRAELCLDSPDRVFKGTIGTYGKIKGAQVFIAFIGDTKDPKVNEKIGYFGEGIILEATARGLDTCWVGGYFYPEIVAGLLGIKENERVYAVTPIGHALEDFSSQEKKMRRFIKAHKRVPMEELVTGIDRDQWPKWIEEALEVGRLSPSAHNNQSWKFKVNTESITISVSKARGKLKQFNRMDCGIALLHIQLGALSAGINGSFRFLNDPDVAVFNTESQYESNN
jgi:nitroreductase